LRYSIAFELENLQFMLKIKYTLFCGVIFFCLFFSCNRNMPSTEIQEEDMNEMEEMEETMPMAFCENGFASIYPCNDYDLMTHMPLSTFGVAEANDSWGWTDPETGKEYALVGTDRSTVFVDITDTENPIYIGNMPTATISSPWRDVKVYQNHAFVVADNVQGEDSHGMQVFDLTRLRNVVNPPQTLREDARLTDIGRAHNIVINESTGYAYIVGGTSANGGPIFVNIQEQKNPLVEGSLTQGGYSHDAQVVTYSGPDSDYTGKEILIGSNENEVVIADVTDKANPTIISTISYSNVEYAHQGWFTEDMRYFILGDEVDEIRVGNNTRLIIFDFTDLDNPLNHFEYVANNPSIDHNGYVKGNTFYQASYRAGLRVLDISNIANRSFTEIAFFDTYPEDDDTNFDGAWNVYPFFESGNIVISDINRGLFVVRKSQ